MSSTLPSPALPWPDPVPLGDRLKAIRAACAEGLKSGLDGISLSASLTADIESLVLAHVTRCLEAEGLVGRSGLAVFATGGFGRREYAPHSDLDLLFLCAGTPDERIERFAQSVLHPLFDARLDAGHATRSIEEALELPDNDLTAATALLDARFVAGDRELADRFANLYSARVSYSRPDDLVGRLRAEQRSRHAKFGDTIFLLEPDIKSGPGGFRDLCAARWAAMAKFGTGEAHALQLRGEMSARQATAFEAAREWLLRVRIAAHLHAGRKQDQLRFDIQEAIAPVVCRHVKLGSGERPSVAPAVEALMRDYQRHARTIMREAERLMQRASVDPHHVPTTTPISLPDTPPGTVDESFVLQDGALEVAEPSVFVRRPAEMFRLFAAAIELDVPVGLRTADMITELAVEKGADIREDPAAAHWFLTVLTDDRDARTPSRLEQMHDLGLLSALMPEWEPCTGRVQYDVYHVYTVDQHSLNAVAMLKSLVRREPVDHHPQPVQEAQLVEKRIPLYLATLLHDVGKPLGKNHSAKGATVAAAMALRLGLDDDDVRRVELLVREHLTMGLISQRRDLDDPSVVAKFARIATDEETLRELYLLTFTDLYCVGPGNLTSWKDGLLREFFRRTLAYLRHGPDLLRSEQKELYEERRQEALDRLEGEPQAEVGAIFDSLPERYFVENQVPRIAAHVKLIRQRRGPCAVAFTHQPRRGYSEMVLVADDVPGLLAKVTGVLFANRIDILDAAIYSRSPAAGRMTGEALDIFRVRKAFQGAVTDDARIASIERDLEAVLSGQRSIEDLVASRPAPSSILDRPKPKVPPTEVKTDNEASADFTVIDIFTEDRPGVLYNIARLLHEKGLDIYRSKVGVEADRVADIFYVRDRATGEKIRDAKRLAELTDVLKRTLERPPGR